MIVTLVWKGHRIPNCDPPSGTADFIRSIESDADSGANLFALWCSLDAILDEPRDADLWDGSSPDEIADLISHPSFIATAGNDDPEFNWAGLPDWVRVNADNLEISA